MKFGMVLSLYAYNPQRVLWAREGLDSLVKTVLHDKAYLYIIEKDCSHFSKVYPIGYNHKLFQVFSGIITPDPPDVGGSDRVFLYGAQKLLANESDVTHLVWLCDDALFHPNWLLELEALINRHPDAKAWSVRRSAHVEHHAPLYESDSDVCVRSLDGLGLTMTREEFLDWGISYKQGDFTNPVSGNTLDLYHAHYRPGERWCTKRSYIDHTGSAGLHVHAGIQGLHSSIDFVGG